ncbi:DNA-binding transcriptional regulator, LysR family [Azotobacter beijerinckii]|uniref:DNA-binding transcriptional regulator, LysR family n=1 Tax=Azotobacter beijerinckii TaxID=170623 RepID=A0A1H6X5U8_9GAMM|nr:LysR family transcriptional regulator [Azotobacter beijerinckii]SEI85217.1 DNA-binding transcriptional regulator, LysR family [Azotobacter beijerinckii]SEJ24533.1 DNA-binding transcriptional regulator, LysR family [Azotobacter beijerinckii]
MDYSAWKLFIDAAELGSLSKAAAAYRTTQPHISRQISALEQECGGRLFQRTGRGVVLTELGKRITPKVRAWLASTDQLANDIRTNSGTPIGTVRLGILPSTAHPLISTLYYKLKEHYPLVQLMVREGQGAQLETWLEKGEVDLAILYRQNPGSPDGDIYLVETGTYLVGAKGDPLLSNATIPFSALHKLPLVSFCRPSSWRDRLDQLCISQGITLNIILEADSLGLQTHIVANGGVYGLLGPYAISAAPERAILQSSRIVNPDVLRHLALAMSRHGELTLACRTVMQLIQEIAKTGVTDHGFL